MIDIKLCILCCNIVGEVSAESCKLCNLFLDYCCCCYCYFTSVSDCIKDSELCLTSSSMMRLHTDFMFSWQREMHLQDKSPVVDVGKKSVY
jgi:hypothetical protein